MSRLDTIQFLCTPQGQIAMYRAANGEVVESKEMTMPLTALVIESALIQGPNPLVVFGNKAGQRIKFTLKIEQEVVTDES